MINLEINQAIEIALSGKALLFLGAGFSTEAININDKNIGDAKAFSRFLCSEMGLDNNDDLSRVSNMFLKKKSPIFLVELLKKEFSCKSIVDSYKVITDINWNRVYTTNYDDVFEFASKQSNKAYTSITINEEPRKYNKREAIIHINGFIGTLTPDKLNNEFKLSSSSYNTSQFSRTNWAALFRNDLNNAKAIIFIGTSLNFDLELKQIINSNPTLKNKIIFIDRKCDAIDVDPFELDAKEDFGIVEFIGLEEFARKILEVRTTYEPKCENSDLDCFCFLNEKNYNYLKPKVSDIWDLLIHGNLNDDIVRSNNADELYLIERYETDEIISRIIDNRVYVLVLHSDLGNGKSCFVRNLAEKAIPYGSVFFLNGNNSSESDIEIIDSHPGKKIIIIENYHDHFKIIELLNNYINDDYKLIFTARTYIHETRFKELISKFKDIEVEDINLNFLKPSDINKLIPLLDRIEKWEEFHGRSDTEKKKLLSKNYESKMCNILIGMLQSKNVQEKINGIYDTIISIPSFKKLLIGVCINSIIDLKLTSYQLVEILEMKDFNTLVKLNEEVRTLINWDENQINIKSPIIAQYLLRNKIRKVDIINTIKTMVCYANDCGINGNYYNVSKKLVSVSNIWLLLNQSEKTVRDLVVELFDNLKDYSVYKDKPFFWLQYAIACLDNNIYDRAEVYFKLAYQKSEEMLGYFDTFQIDTHYSRFLIENSIANNIYSEKDTSFTEAHRLLSKSLNSSLQNYRYVLKQLPLYRKYWKKFKSLLNAKQKNELIRSFKYMVQRIQEYEQRKNTNVERYLIDTRKELQSTIAEIYASVAE